MKNVFVMPAEPEKNAPHLQSGKVVRQSRFSAFGLSAQGLSHVKKETPCQDNNDFRYLPGADLMMAAISDGVGSCPLSQWGSYLAVQVSLDYLEEKLRAASHGRPLELSDDQWIYECLLDSFRKARDTIDELAQANGQDKWNFQCTLTVILYDGSTLWCCHAGDDGVVVQFEDGFVKMVTQRLKGEEASSVYPLQSGEGYWRVNKVASQAHGSVVGLAMATDGVLDAFVMDNPRYLDVDGCCSGVFYPFIHDAFYDDNSEHPCDPNQRLADYTALMQDESYRTRVTDDLTFVSILSVPGMRKGVVPVFDMDKWNQIAAALQAERRSGLYQTGNLEKAKAAAPAAAITMEAAPMQQPMESPYGSAQDLGTTRHFEPARPSAQPAPNQTRQSMNNGNAAAPRASRQAAQAPQAAQNPAPRRTRSSRNDCPGPRYAKKPQKSKVDEVLTAMTDALGDMGVKIVIIVGGVIGLLAVGVLIGMLLSKPAPTPASIETTAETQESTEALTETEATEEETETTAPETTEPETTVPETTAVETTEVTAPRETRAVATEPADAKQQVPEREYDEQKLSEPKITEPAPTEPEDLDLEDPEELDPEVTELYEPESIDGNRTGPGKVFLEVVEAEPGYGIEFH